jgi:hypothetical protein
MEALAAELDIDLAGIAGDATETSREEGGADR